ncbi:MAG: Rnf-Nqr domain containing protein [Faecalibacterium sp.]
MKAKVAQEILKDPEKFAHHDRVFLNNPVVMQGMGLAPLVVLATSGRNALMLATAVALLLTPSRLLACLFSRLFPLSDKPTREQLQKNLLPRCLIYCFSTSVVYLGAYPILNALFGMELLTLGIYLPMLVVEPLLLYRFGRVQEAPRKALSKGVRITLGYALILLLVGCAREWLAMGTVFGVQAAHHTLLPMASMPAGGFIVLGVLCALWRALAHKYKEYLKTEARNLAVAQYQKEEQEQ